jgi:DNA-binding MarR family transcriptional regulator
MTRWLTPEEQRAWRAYRRMVLLVDSRIARDLLRDSGLSMPDYTVLSAISETPDGRRRLSELATRMQWSASRLSHHVSRMEQRQLVRRAECAEDGRGAWIEITDDGWTAIRAAAPEHVASVRSHLVDVLSAEQVRTLGELAETVVRAFGEDCLDVGPPDAAEPDAGPQDAGPRDGGPPDDAGAVQSAAAPGQSANRSPVSRS